MAATTIYRPFPSPDSNHESLSLRSFRVPTSPPSLKASSLKLRGSLSSFIGARGRSRPPEPTLKDLQAADDALILAMGLSTSSNVVPNDTAKTTKTEQATLQRPRSKSRTIIRMLTTKFKPRSTSTSPPRHIIPPPPAIPNVFGKDQRDAALRERGLLPPLPNKDLSTQEMEQDQFIPVVSSFDEPEKQPDEANPSAADLIKKEWVSKNHNVERERMNSFKFGGGVSPVSESFVADLPTPTAAAQGPANVDPVSPPPVEALPPVPTLEPTNLPPPPSESNDRTSLEVDVPAEVQAYMFPLPPSRSPSPSSTKGGFSFPPASPTIPPSPSLLSIPDTPYSLHTTVGAGSGTNTPRPLDTTPIPLPVPPSPPAISLTPPTDFVPPPSKEAKKSVDDSIISAFHSRTDSFAQLEESISSSATVPSLDASNSTATTDSVASSSPNADAAATTPTKTSAPTPKGKLGGLTVRTNDAPVIPVIVESPIVDGFSNELEVVVEEPLSILMEDTDKEADDDINEKTAMSSLLTPPQSPQSPSAAGAARVPNPRKRRGLTDPTSVGARRKSLSLNPFKRGATLDNNTGDELKPPRSPTTNNRRLSVATSFSSIRRSVAGTLSLKKGPLSPSGDGKGRRFDASHLPPSPTLPESFRSASPALRGARSPPVRTRTAVAPVLYSRGSILLETSNIEDEETRHRTEMAFLG